MRRSLSGLLLPLLLGLLLLAPARAWAGPVSWKEVSPTAEGRQWWDEGSLRRNKAGHLTVLSRFQAAPETDAPVSTTAVSDDVTEASRGAAANRRGPSDAGSPAPTGSPPGAPSLSASASGPAGSLPADVDRSPSSSVRSATLSSRLYVMELDCDQSLYRDISINGLPQFGAAWQPTGNDDLTAEVLRQACAAGAA